LTHPSAFGNPRTTFTIGNKTQKVYHASGCPSPDVVSLKIAAKKDQSFDNAGLGGPLNGNGNTRDPPFLLERGDFCKPYCEFERATCGRE